MSRKRKKRLLKKIVEFAYTTKQSDFNRISPESYRKYLIDQDNDANKDKAKAAFERAWNTRNFEIERYWQRATYFWAFQAAAFAGYFAVVNSNVYRQTPFTLYCIICIGLITGFAWALINIGSKFWQRHWEKHIDMLEDQFTGPLYKIVYTYKHRTTFSVSKINDIISRFFITIWFLLAIKYFKDNINLHGRIEDIAWLEILATIFTMYFVSAMLFGHGRGRFGASEFEFNKREVFK